jgi:hypothetical protein
MAMTGLAIIARAVSFFDLLPTLGQMAFEV